MDAIADAERRALAAAAEELRSERPPHDSEAETQRFVNELCDYHPPGDGFTYVAWLDHVQAVLDAAARP